MTSKTKTLRATALVATSVLGLSLSGCEHLEQKGAHIAAQTILEPSQRHPILVSQQPTKMSLRVVRGSDGLNPQQRARVVEFVGKYRGTTQGAGRIVVSVPSGAANETAAMQAVTDLRAVLSQSGIGDGDIHVEAYHSDHDPQPPIRVSYTQFVAQGPECGHWPGSLGDTSRNTAWHNYGCAQQRNLAAAIVNPSDLLGPRASTPPHSERRMTTMQKYISGKPSGAERAKEDERASRERSN